MKFYLPLLLLLVTSCGSKKEDAAPAPTPAPSGPYAQAYLGYEWQGMDVPVTLTKSLSATPSAAWTTTATTVQTNYLHFESPIEFHPAIAGETMTVTVTIPRKPTNAQNHFIWVPLYANKGMLATDNTKPLARDQARDVLSQQIILSDADIMNAANYGPNGYVVTRTVTLP